MRKLILFLITLFIFVITALSQELNCEVVVNADRVVSGNQQLFENMQTAISEFINQTRWTDKNFDPQERITCSMIININKQIGSNGYEAGIQVQASRPVYESVYITPILNHNDKNFDFSYTEGEPLIYNPNVYQSELISILSYYAYFILGMDADTFAPMGGTPYFQKCMTIADQVENKNGIVGWNPNTSRTNRYTIIKAITDPSNSIFRKSMYKYHREGLDMMTKNLKKAKEAIRQAIIDLNVITMQPSSSILLRMFMDAKADEITSIFSGGPITDTVELRNILNKISPINAQKWAQIK